MQTFPVKLEVGRELNDSNLYQSESSSENRTCAWWVNRGDLIQDSLRWMIKWKPNSQKLLPHLGLWGKWEKVSKAGIIHRT